MGDDDIREEWVTHEAERKPKLFFCLDLKAVYFFILTLLKRRR